LTRLNALSASMSKIPSFSAPSRNFRIACTAA
jgi:hypothetical protein